MTLHSAFYRFSALDDVDAVIVRLKALTAALKGSILVAPEGINGMVAGVEEDVTAFEHALRNDAAFGGRFRDIVFKRSPSAAPPFGRMKVKKKREIVPLGIDGVDATGDTGINVPPAAWRSLIAAPDVVVIDNRNSFEYRLGHFAGAVDPGVAKFRDFPDYVRAQLPRWREEGKRIAMYCTGGIRCEKAGAWMRQSGIDVYQLEGGILNYFLQMPDAEKDWQGECFVFDNRIALDTTLAETGTTLEEAYAGEADTQWRMARAQRLKAAVE